LRWCRPGQATRSTAALPGGLLSARLLGGRFLGRFRRRGSSVRGAKADADLVDEPLSDVQCLVADVDGFARTAARSGAVTGAFRM
jgi:hypothetical protein